MEVYFCLSRGILTGNIVFMLQSWGERGLCVGITVVTLQYARGVLENALLREPYVRNGLDMLAHNVNKLSLKLGCMPKLMRIEIKN